MKKNQKISTLQKELHIKIEKDTGNRLDKFISEYHLPKGYVVNEAISRYLDLNSAKTHTHMPEYLSGIGLTPGIKEIIQTIKNKGFDNEITQADIEEAIRTVRGHDPRTLKGWKKSLEEVGFIKETIRQSWKVAVYKLDWSMLDQSLWPESIKNRPSPKGETQDVS
jgi:ribosomal protein L31E